MRRPAVGTVRGAVLLLLLALAGPTPSRAGALQPGDLLIGQAGYTVVRVDPVSGAQEPIAGGGILDRVLGLAVGRDGRIYVLGFDYDAGPRLFRVDAGTGSVTVVAALALGPEQAVPLSLAFDRNGNVLYFTNDAVHRVNVWLGTDSVIATLPPAPGLSRAIAQAHDGTYVLSDADQGTLRRFDAASGTVTPIASGLHLGGFFRSHGIAVDAAGFVVGPRFSPGAILRIDPGTGEETVVAEGPDLVDLWHVALDRDGDVLVPSLLSGDITRIDAVTGLRTVIPTGLGITGFAMVPYPECDDFRDNDADGWVDLQDPQCLASATATEAPPPSCGLGFEIAILLPPLAALRRGRAHPGAFA